MFPAISVSIGALFGLRRAAGVGGEWETLLGPASTSV